jgi:hypothetical protein
MIIKKKKRNEKWRRRIGEKRESGIMSHAITARGRASCRRRRYSARNV